ARPVGDERLLHLHRLEDDDELAGRDRRAVLDGDLDDRALHGGGEGAVARGGGGACAAAAGGTADRTTASAAGADAQAGGQHDLQPLAPDLDDDPLGRVVGGVGRDGGGSLGSPELREALGEVGLDPRRVDGEGGGGRGGELRRVQDGAREGH